MPRLLRCYRPGEVVTITSRILDGRYALVPKPKLIAELRGILAQAKLKWPAVKLYDAVTMSNHAHLKISGPEANTVGRWASWVFAAFTRAAQYHNNFKGPAWGRRYCAIQILDEASHAQQVHYFMAQACNAECDLVASPRLWPGLNCVDALCRGVEMKGSYVTADERRKALGPKRDGELPMNRTLTLDPLPGLPEKLEARQTWYRKIEQAIIADAKARGTRYRAPAFFTRVDPKTVPKTFEATPAPACHTVCPRKRQAFKQAWAAFTARWREALEDFKRGVCVCFPEGSWWPYGCDAVAPRPLVQRE